MFSGIATSTLIPNTPQTLGKSQGGDPHQQALAELHQWKDSAPPGEGGARDIAVARIESALACEATELNLSGLELTTLPGFLPTGLKILDLSGCTSLTALPQTLPDGLTRLDLSGCTSLMALPPILPAGLTLLYISGCTSLTALPQTLSPNLKIFGADHLAKKLLLPPAPTSSKITAINEAISARLEELKSPAGLVSKNDTIVFMDEGQDLVTYQPFDPKAQEEWVMVRRGTSNKWDLLMASTVQQFLQLDARNPITKEPIQEGHIVRGQDVLGYLQDCSVAS